MACFVSAAIKMTHAAFRPATQKRYNSMFRTFVAFAIFMKFNLQLVSPLHILAYLEFLASNNIVVSKIGKHMSAIKSKFVGYNLDTTCFLDKRFKHFNKAVLFNRPFRASIKKVIDISTFQRIVLQCVLLFMGQVYNGLYL